MAYHYKPDSVLLNEVSQVLGASVTAQAVTIPFRISHSGSLNILIGVKCASVTAGAGITAKLQSSLWGNSQSDWIDGNSVSVTGNGWFYIRMNVQTSADQSKLPLGDVGQVVVTTGAGSAVTVSAVVLLQGQ
jgi:hypothetical protein